MQIPKFAFIGSSCAGKTTLTYQVCGELKRYGVRVDGILQQDRRLPFPSELLDTRFEAQEWFLGNMLQMESYMSLQRGTDVVVSDRSVLDFFCYMKVQWGEDPKYKSKVAAWERLVREHEDSYTDVYYCHPLDYDNDGVRPNQDFITKVDESIRTNFPDVVVCADRTPRNLARDIIIKSAGDLLNSPPVLTGSWALGTEKYTSDLDLFTSRRIWSDYMHPSVAAAGKSFVRVADNTKRNDQGCVGVYRVTDTRPQIEIQVFEDAAIRARQYLQLTEQTLHNATSAIGG